MLKLTLRGLLAHKIRFALTTFAVILGVAFVTGAFVLTDSLRQVFDDLVADVTEDVDVEVRGETTFDDGTGLTPPIEESVLDTVLAVDGVADASVTVEAPAGLVVPVEPDGDPLDTFGPPILAFNWSEGVANPTAIEEGRAPEGPGEFVMDLTTADDEDFVVGETYEVVVPDGRIEATLVGTIRFGEDNTLAGAVLTQWDEDTLQSLLGQEGIVSAVSVSAEEGVSTADLIGRIQDVLPDGVEAVTGEVVVEEDSEDFDTVISIFGNVLLGFAAVSLFVSAFIINNTFNIVLGQRIRELALLRAIGAGGSQVRWSVIGEAVIVGVLASVIGLGAGLLLAVGIRELLNVFGFGLPSGDLKLEPVTIIVAFVIGLGVTLLSSLSPARKASRVPPVAAMREGFVLGSGEGVRRTIVGGIILALGLAGMAWGLFGQPDGVGLLLAVAGGALAVFIGVSMLSPLFASPVARFLGAPLPHLPWLGISGRLARENSARNNKRTASTAAALMIGLALVAAASVVGQSMKTTFRETLSSSVQADYFVRDESFSGFSPELAQQLEAAPEFESVTGFRFGRIRVEGDTKDVGAADLTELPGLLDVDVQSGDVAAAAGGAGILLHEDPAEDYDLEVGDVVTVAFADGQSEDLPVAAIYEDASIMGNYTIDLATWDAHFPVDSDVFVAAKAAEGVSPEQGRAILEELATEFPVEVEDRAEFQDSQEAQLDSVLAIVNGLLAFTIIIALLGITNTLALAVFERTREIGLLRAVGMSRRQTRSMIRWEAGIVSLFGAVLGTIVGIAFGWAAVTALPDSIVDTFDVPAVTLVVYVVIAALAGLVAAYFPARRAARLNVLDAISHL